jgi:hypothetical protein
MERPWESWRWGATRLLNYYLVNFGLEGEDEEQSRWEQNHLGVYNNGKKVVRLEGLKKHWVWGSSADKESLTMPVSGLEGERCEAQSGWVMFMLTVVLSWVWMFGEGIVKGGEVLLRIWCMDERWSKPNLVKGDFGYGRDGRDH